MSQRELDEESEAHLQQRYGESLDFAIENSLPFLLRDGLISRGPQARLPPDTPPSCTALLWPSQ